MSSLARLLFLSFAAAAFLLLAPPAHAVNFTCTSTGVAARCHALLGYVPGNSTTLAAVKSLFQLRSFRVLLAANNLPLSTLPSYAVPAGSTVRVRFPCVCSGGTGVYKGRPVYTLRAGDSLDSVARDVFGGFVTYQEIAVANNILDPSRVQAGQKVWIPLPCSCDQVAGPWQPVMHYARTVAAGNSVEQIAAEFGTTDETLMKVNGINDPKSLQSGQILDVPVRACSSSISSTALDYGFRVPNGSYLLTANNCILCSCSSSSWQLDCHPTNGISTSVCPAATCGALSLGNSTESTSSVCESQTCVYAGYTNSTSFTILTNLTTQSLCNNEGAPLPQPNGGSLLRPGVNLQDLLMACTVQMILIWFGSAKL